jgi:O-antigen biosynthesis protein
MRMGSRFLSKPRSKAAASRRPSAKELDAIRNSLFFNSKHYLETNPDVRAAGLDAALHYLVHGGREGRDPGPFFSTKAYLARYPDVAEADLNALLHYETQGRRQNRVAAA